MTAPAAPCKWIFRTLLAVSLLAAFSSPALARTRHHAVARHHTAARGHVTHAAYAPPSSSFIMDASTGAILEQNSPDLSVHPASLTKVMTLLLTFEALERGDLRLRDPVYISNHAASMSPSKLDLSPGSSIAVQDALYAVITHSANDVAVGLAEKLGGTEGRFAIMMNRRAQQLGMTRTRFANASGLPDPMQVTTARDMAMLARYLILAHPQYYRLFATRTFIYRGNVYRNHNHLMDTYPGMDGLKTGFIQQSGFNLIASARRGGHRLIGVVFGGRTTNSRNIEMATLLNQGFSRVSQIASASPATYEAPAQQMAALDPAAGASPAADEETDPALNKFSALTGQGDFDPATSHRLETGLLAVNAVKADAANGWAVQIAAGNSRAAIDQLVRVSLTRLPPDLAAAQPVIVPLKTADGWMFRGRLNGYTHDQAFAACKLLPDCVPVSPQAY